VSGRSTVSIKNAPIPPTTVTVTVINDIYHMPKMQKYVKLLEHGVIIATVTLEKFTLTS